MEKTTNEEKENDINDGVNGINNETQYYFFSLIYNFILPNSKRTFIFSELVYDVQHIPFFSLNTINLSYNNIEHSSSVLSLICWPSLSHVVLTANTISLNKNMTKFKKFKSTLRVYDIKIER